MYKDLTDLGEQVDQDTIVVTTLGDLRKAIGYDRLGKYVLDEVASGLEGEGLGCFPVEILKNNPEPRQWQEVRIYRRGKGVGRLIEAVTAPTVAGDRLLREDAGEGADVVRQIRALVCPE
ncbi:hypothetical protein [Nocardioides dilutus]